MHKKRHIWRQLFRMSERSNVKEMCVTQESDWARRGDIESVKTCVMRGLYI